MPEAMLRSFVRWHDFEDSGLYFLFFYKNLFVVIKNRIKGGIKCLFGWQVAINLYMQKSRMYHLPLRALMYPRLQHTDSDCFWHKEKTSYLESQARRLGCLAFYSCRQRTAGFRPFFRLALRE